MESHVPIAVPDLGVPDFHAVLMVFWLGRACPANQLRQPIHLSGEKVPLWRSPGPVTERLMIDDLDQSSRLAVHRKRYGRFLRPDVGCHGGRVHFAPPFWPSSNPTANAASRCLQCFPLRERTLM